MRPFLFWVACATSGVVVGYIDGWLIGGTIAWISIDYVPDEAWYVHQGEHLGFVAGAFLAACALMGQKRPASLPLVVRNAVGAWGCTLAGSAASATLFYVASRAQLIRQPLGWGVEHPNRVFACWGLERGIVLAAFLSTALAGWRVGRGRA